MLTTAVEWGNRTGASIYIASMYNTKDQGLCFVEYVFRPLSREVLFADFSVVRHPRTSIHFGVQKHVRCFGMSSATGLLVTWVCASSSHVVHI